MLPHRLLALLVCSVFAACAEAPDAPSPEGTESPVETPVEVPPEQRTVPGTTREEPGVPGSDRPEGTWILSREGVCYAYARYVVRTRPKTGAPGEDIAVVRRPSGSGRDLCNAPEGDAVFSTHASDGAESFFGLTGDLLLLDEGTGPEGRTLRVLDLAGGRVVHETTYEEPIQIEEGALVYGMEPEVVGSMDEIDALGVECPEAAVWLSEGLGVGLSPQMRFDLAARAAAPTGEVLCVPIQ